MLSPNDVVEHLAYTYVYAVATQAHCSFSRTTVDRDSIDIRLEYRNDDDIEAIYRSPTLDLQVKGHCIDDPPDEDLTFDLTLKNYNDLRKKTMNPRILVVVVVPKRTEERVLLSNEQLILRRCGYWLNLNGQPETSNQTKQRIKLIRSQIFDPPTLSRLMGLASRQETLV